MHTRPFHPADLPELIELTIDTFGPSYEQSFRPTVGEAIFRHQHGNWREDYRSALPAMHDPGQDKYVAVAYRRQGLGAALCEHAFAEMRARGVEVVEIHTGGDTFHAPARALYEHMGCVLFPAAIYFKEL